MGRTLGVCQVGQQQLGGCLNALLAAWVYEGMGAWVGGWCERGGRWQAWAGEERNRGGVVPRSCRPPSPHCPHSQCEPAQGGWAGRGSCLAHRWPPPAPQARRRRRRLRRRRRPRPGAGTARPAGPLQVGAREGLDGATHAPHPAGGPDAPAGVGVHGVWAEGGGAWACASVMQHPTPAVALLPPSFPPSLHKRTHTNTHTRPPLTRR